MKKKLGTTLPEYFLLAASNCALRMLDIVLILFLKASCHSFNRHSF